MTYSPSIFLACVADALNLLYIASSQTDYTNGFVRGPAAKQAKFLLLPLKLPPARKVVLTLMQDGSP